MKAPEKKEENLKSMILSKNAPLIFFFLNLDSYLR